MKDITYRNTQLFTILKIIKNGLLKITNLLRPTKSFVNE
jgi:hypothetical protein